MLGLYPAFPYYLHFLGKHNKKSNFVVIFMFYETYSSHCLFLSSFSQNINFSSPSNSKTPFLPMTHRRKVHGELCLKLPLLVSAALRDLVEGVDGERGLGLEVDGEVVGGHGAVGARGVHVLERNYDLEINSLTK